MKFAAILPLAVVTLMTVVSCNRQAKWTLSGEIDGADNARLKIERAENGVWLTLDTLSTDSKGKFKYSRIPLGYPDIYRLVYNDKYIYFPIDSVETVRIKSTADGFASDYEISGSTYADNMMTIDRLVGDRVKAVGADSALTDSLLKRQLNELVIADPAAITAYYIVLKQIDGRFLYNPANPADNRIIGAIANAYTETRPGDPRTRFMKEIYMKNRPNRGQGAEQFEVTELPYYDIDLMDQDGTHHVLSDIVSKNKVVLLNFTAYSAEESPAFNIMLADSYRKYHDRGMEIYQVSFDGDEYQWGQTARNLPWITVYNPMVGQSQNMVQLYNVQGLPTTYLFVNGELVERIEDYSKLDAIVSSRF